ncbi:MAG: ATP-binding protein [Acidimicrobiia bacterium]
MSQHGPSEGNAAPGTGDGAQAGQFEAIFEPAPASVPAARGYVVSLLGSSDEDALSRVAMLTSELATNAILHARTSFVVSVSRAGTHVRVEVSDANTQPVVVKDYGPTSPTGRGMHIVGALADRWGVEPTPEGKTVWFELDFEAVPA